MQLEIDKLSVILREKRVCWFGHVERSSGAIKMACDIQIDGKHGPGRLKMSCRETVVRGISTRLTLVIRM